jgi:hypothetical protein
VAKILAYAEEPLLENYALPALQTSDNPVHRSNCIFHFCFGLLLLLYKRNIADTLYRHCYIAAVSQFFQTLQSLFCQAVRQRIRCFFIGGVKLFALTP